MNIAIIDGYLGAGKTLAMTLLSTYFIERSNGTLLTNYGVKNSLPFSHYRDFITVAQQESSIIGLDEAHVDLDARNFNTNVVKFFTTLVYFFRKLRTTIFLSTPRFDDLDLRIRGICNLYIKASKDKINFYYDMYDIQSGRFLMRYKIKRDSAIAVASLIYDTHNMVLPVEFPSEKKDFNLFMEELKLVNDEWWLQKKSLLLSGEAVAL